MALAKCSRCETLFNKMSASVCPQCIEDEEDDFETIRTCLQENPDISAEAVSKLSGVDLKCVLRMLDQDLISNVSVSGPVKCGQCGAPAISHAKRLCQACLEKLNRKMVEARNAIHLEQRKQAEVGEYMNVRQELDLKRKN